ncbi:MAG: GIY-YIG nuclease family protein [Gemmatimonadetes bacterium]|nr:GIY-YIG nuclease family protein [Gemmatimonadota bacterium]
MPKGIPERGIYLFSEGQRHLYVGRTNRIRRRIQNHYRKSGTHNQATFAFRIARADTGLERASYRPDGSREELEKDAVFGPAFAEAKARVGRMDLRYVREDDPTRQALLEIYVATVLATPFNDFENH